MLPLDWLAQACNGDAFVSRSFSSRDSAARSRGRVSSLGIRTALLMDILVPVCIPEGLT
jgi:hypothetical protein